MLLDVLHLSGDRTASHLSRVHTASNRSKDVTLIEVAKSISEWVRRRIGKFNITRGGDKVWNRGNVSRSTHAQVIQSRVQIVKARLFETKKIGDNWKGLSILDSECEWEVWNTWRDADALLRVDGVGGANLRV